MRFTSMFCFCMRACVSGFEYVCGEWVCLTFGLVFACVRA
jgi:hypothetical protein